MTELIKKIIRINSHKTVIFLTKIKKQNISEIEKYAQLGQISTGLIHDLLSPITALGIQLEMFKNNNRNEKTMLAVKETIKDITRYSVLIKQYISGDKTKMWLNLEKEIQKSLKLISYSAIKNSVTINFLRKNDIKIFANKIQIYQIIISLVSNAIESFEEKSGNKKVIIKAEKINEKIIITVKDFGKGIKNTREIFSPFYTTKKETGGTGIGLSSVKYIVEKELGGRIEVKSKVDEGTEFKILI